MSRYEKYPAYRDSGVEWIGEIPGHWEVTRLKRVARFAYGDSLAAENRVEGRVGVFGSNGEVGFHNKANTKSPVIIIGRKGSYGKLTFIDSSVFAIDTTYFIDSENTQSNLRWLYYGLGCLALDKDSKDSAVPGLAREDAYKKSIPVPPLEEQQAIASFLDRKTAQINDLITKKEELLKKLDEKRTALITRAVTKGLDPSAPMKDSGIEWIGEIPKHWVIWKVTHGFNTIGSGTTPKSDNSDFYDGNIPWVTTSELRETVIENTSQKISIDAFQSHSALKIYPAGSIVIAMYGATIGRLGILGVDATVNQACCVFAQPTTFKPRFFYYWLLMRKPILISLSTGGGQPNLSLEDLKNIRIPTPPLEEQQAIAEQIEKKTAIIDRQKTQVTEAIERLKEYRSALITDAVTGKMDVHSIGKKESLST